jgi:hypothetical protein
MPASCAPLRRPAAARVPHAVLWPHAARLPVCTSVSCSVLAVLLGESGSPPRPACARALTHNRPAAFASVHPNNVEAVYGRCISLRLLRGGSRRLRPVQAAGGVRCGSRAGALRTGGQVAWGGRQGERAVGGKGRLNRLYSAHKEPGLSSSLSPCATADQRNFPIEPAHRCLLSLSIIS